MPTGVTVVTPCDASDLERFAFLRESMAACGAELPHVVVVPDDDGGLSLRFATDPTCGSAPIPRYCRAGWSGDSLIVDPEDRRWCWLFDDVTKLNGMLRYALEEIGADKSR